VNKNLKAHAAVLFTNLFFAANFTFVKLISPSRVAPFGLNLFRVAICVFLFWGVWMLGKTAAGIERKDWKQFFLCALTGIAINQMLFLKGLTMTSTVHASLLMLTTPLLITVFALWVLKERLTKIKGLGLLLGIAGAIMIVASREGGEQHADYLLGDLLIFVNAISYSLYFILVKPLMAKYNPLHVIRWIFTIGFFLILPFGWSDAVDTDFYSFAITDWLAFSAVILLGTFLAYYFNGYGISKLGASITGAYIYTQPIFAVIISSIILKETLSLQKIIAACLIFSGVYLVSKKNN
jgi:drug/metabolite transporter (DMT)-like permease